MHLLHKNDFFYVCVANIVEWLIYECTYTRQAQSVMATALYFLKKIK